MHHASIQSIVKAKLPITLTKAHDNNTKKLLSLALVILVVNCTGVYVKIMGQHLYINLHINKIHINKLMTTLACYMQLLGLHCPKV